MLQWAKRLQQAPDRRLAIALLLALGLPAIAGTAWMVTATRAADAAITQLSHEQRALGDARLYDEVLTMSARMAAQTGEPVWATRYEQAALAMRASLSDAERWARGTELVNLLRTSTVNAALIAIERQALALASQQRLPEAQALLAGRSYAALRTEYANTISRGTAAFQRDLEDQVWHWRGMMLLQVLITLATILLIMGLTRELLVRARRAERSMRDSMDAAVIGMALTSERDVIEYANPALSGLLGSDDLVGRRLHDFLEDRADSDAPVAGDGQPHVCDTVEHQHQVRAPTRVRWVRHAVSHTTGLHGRGQVHQFIDDTNVRELQAEMAFRASHDALTGLANRAVVMEALERWTDDRRGPGDAVGVLYCDLDGLKAINDIHGHAAGDAVLAAVAARMTDAVRASDLVARLGGDEFVVLMPGIHGVPELLVLAEKLRSIVGEDVGFGGSTITTSVSVGGTLVDIGDDADAALARADDALYAAKAAGRNRVNVA